ncbi:MAG: NUDIX domain-containing protein [Gammaproteobacteria bacterium]|nr:NUDIX domain-containing protein [Gammaproteobacteria bacterium]MXX95494.1 NUDIX domain-containing protein [Gammaproteobacteria bacterium]MYF52789.1 NUDIX domain-containing protein [Gammaproteobacteria bacterium]MYK42623.1 NUDIX domain-containing protein [Gammaproteobacteria bacterium]
MNQVSSEVSIPTASTLVLLRDNPEGYEVLLLKRTKQSTFPNLYVFPGGKVDPDDANCEKFSDSLTDREASDILDVKQNGLRYWIAAIRECFEECGVLFARKSETLTGELDPKLIDELKHVRDSLCTAKTTFQSLLEEFSLQLMVSKVHYLSHWITPKVMPARFDTRFFIGVMTNGQGIDVHSSELVSGEWVRPKIALHRHAKKTWNMILPTITTLRMISSFENTATLIDYVKRGYHKIPVLSGLPIQGMQPYVNRWR